MQNTTAINFGAARKWRKSRFVSACFLTLFGVSGCSQHFELETRKIPDANVSWAHTKIPGDYTIKIDSSGARNISGIRFPYGLTTCEFKTEFKNSFDRSIAASMKNLYERSPNMLFMQVNGEAPPEAGQIHIRFTETAIEGSCTSNTCYATMTSSGTISGKSLSGAPLEATITVVESDSTFVWLRFCPSVNDLLGDLTERVQRKFIQQVGEKILTQSTRQQ